MRSLILLSCLLFTLNVTARAAEVRLATLEYPPYSSEYLPGGGTMVELSTRAFAVVGYDARIEFRPWARVLAELHRGKYDGLLALWPDDLIADGLVGSEPLMSSDLGFFVRQNTPVTFATLSDLKGRKVGVSLGYNYPAEIINSGIITEDAVNDLSNLRKLAAGRFDLVLLERQVGEYLIKLNPDLQGKLAWQGQTLIKIPLIAGFIKTQAPEPNWTELYSKGLSILRKSGEYERILRGSNQTTP